MSLSLFLPVRSLLAPLNADGPANAVRGSKQVNSKSAEEGFEALSKYAQNLTALAEQGKLDPVIGRDTEIRRCVRILSRRTKNNPVLIGEPGVGKTAIAEGLAQRIVARDVPPNLLGQLWSLDMGALLAGASYKGQYEERIKSVIDGGERSESGFWLSNAEDLLHDLVTSLLSLLNSHALRPPSRIPTPEL
ncbi:hypothetical protein JCM6882_003761 [Rhodosporidiobolus microsporus]